MTQLDKILEERGQQNGDYGLQAEISQQIKDAIYSTGCKDKMTPYQKESVEMIAHKLARLSTGDIWHEDHWRDIAGYAQLAADRVQTRNANQAHNIPPHHSTELEA